jgi:hypothetical protein
MELTSNQMWQTKARGTNSDEYSIYLDLSNDGNGNDFVTGEPLLSYDEWLAK